MLAKNAYRRIILSATGWFAMMIMMCSAGCTGLRLPAIDPSGERIFLPAPNSTTFDDGSSFRGPAWTAAPQAPLCGTPAASTAVVPYSLNTPTPPLFGPGVPNPYANPYGQPAALPFAAERLTGQTSANPRDGIAGQLKLSAQRLVVPVGQEVILRAAICGSDGYLVTREPIEWSLAPNSVGTIVEVDQQDKALWRQLLRRPPTKTASDFARGLTSREPQIVPRGSASPYDDLQLARGETWISLTSASLGETHVHCLAPTVAGWEQRRASTTIQWVGPNGPAPPAGTPGLPTPGPATPPANTQPTLPDNPPVTSTPAAQPNVKLTIDGPRQAKADDELLYTIKIRNDGRAEANDVIVSSKIPFGLAEYLRSEPVASVFDDRLEWNIGTLPPGQSQDVTFRLKALRSGQMRIPGTLVYRGANRTEEFFDTNIALNPISVRVVSPETALNGQRLNLDIQVTNHSDRDLNNVNLRTTYDPRFYPIVNIPQENSGAPANPNAPKTIEASIPKIEANRVYNIPISFNILGEGRLCYNVAVSTADGNKATTESCVNVGPDAAFDSPAFDGATRNPARRLDLAVQKTGPYRMAVGDRRLYRISVVNTGNVPLTRLLIEDKLDGKLDPRDATTGVRRNNANSISWTLPRLDVGATEIFEVDCEAIQPGRSCNIVTVESAEGITRDAQWCVEIVGGGASLQSPLRHRAVETSLVAEQPRVSETMRSRSPFSPFQPLGTGRPTRQDGAADSTPGTPRNTIRQSSFQQNSTSNQARPTPMAGDWQVDIRRTANSQQHDRLTYTVDITNHHAHTEQGIRLMIESPKGTRFASSINPPMIREVRRSSDGRTVEFLPVSSLRPNETATFQIVVQQQSSVQGKFRAKVSSDRWPNGSVFTD